MLTLRFIQRFIHKLAVFLPVLGVGLLVLVLCVGSPVVLSGCFGSPTPPADATAEEGNEEETPPEGEDEGEEGEEGKAKPPTPDTHAKKETPLATPQALLATYAHTVLQWHMSDGTVLKGTLYDPFQRDNPPPPPPPPKSADEEEEDAPAEDEDAPPKPPPKKPEPPEVRYPLVILLHSLSESQQTWAAFTKTLVDDGYAVLALDLRGHGQSTRTAEGLVKNWRTLTPTERLAWVTDMEKLRIYWDNLEHTPNAPLQVQGRDRVLIAAGLGANIALTHVANVAKRTPPPYRGVVAFCPTLDSKNIQPALPLVKASMPPVFYASSQTNPTSFDDTKTLYKLTQGHKSLNLYEDIGTNEALLLHHTPLQQKVLAWLHQVLPPETGD